MFPNRNKWNDLIFPNIINTGAQFQNTFISRWAKSVFPKCNYLIQYFRRNLIKPN